MENLAFTLSQIHTFQSFVRIEIEFLFLISFSLSLFPKLKTQSKFIEIRKTQSRIISIFSLQSLQLYYFRLYIINNISQVWENSESEFA